MIAAYPVPTPNRQALRPAQAVFATPGELKRVPRAWRRTFRVQVPGPGFGRKTFRQPKSAIGSGRGVIQYE